MSAQDLIITMFYGALALAARMACAGRRDGQLIDHELAAIGLVLVFNFVMSNVIYWAMPLDFRPAFYTVLEAGFSVAAAVAFAVHPRVLLIAMVAVSALSIWFNFQLAQHLLMGALPPGAEFHHALMTNLCSGTQALLAILTGGIGEYRLDRFRGRSRHRHLAAQLDARQVASPPPAEP